MTKATYTSMVKATLSTVYKRVAEEDIYIYIYIYIYIFDDTSYLEDIIEKEEIYDVTTSWLYISQQLYYCDKNRKLQVP